MKERTSLSNQDSIGTNSWWLRETKGATISDKFYLSFLKIIYRGIRFSFRIALGKKRTDMFYTKRGINFKDFLYRSIKFLKIGDPLMLEIYVPKYNYNIYCPLNKEDFIVMTRHEDDIIERFLPKQGDIVVDIGANIGRYTIISSKRVGANGKVVAIEAHPGNFEMLNSNIKLNQLTNVISGVGVEEESVEVNWIKIDVEGAEFEVLKGATNVLSKSKDIALLMEVHGPPHVYRPKVEEFVDLYNFKIEFEKSYEENGSMHIIMQKSA